MQRPEFISSRVILDHPPEIMQCAYSSQKIPGGDDPAGFGLHVE
jgi:hypothetical protein